MSRKLLAFLLGELETIRVLCQNNKCEGTVELKIKDLDRHFQEFKCPLCRNPFHVGKQDLGNYLLTLQSAIEGLKQAQENVKVEFVLPRKDATKPVDPVSPS